MIGAVPGDPRASLDTWHSVTSRAVPQRRTVVTCGLKQGEKPAHEKTIVRAVRWVTMCVLATGLVTRDASVDT